MGINPLDFRLLVVRPLLSQLGDDTPLRENLILLHAGIMSHYGHDLLSATGSGDARYGMYQITRVEHRALWDEQLAFHSDLASKIRGLASQHDFLQDPEQELVVNLRYATAIAWAQTYFALPYLDQPTATVRQLVELWQQVWPNDAIDRNDLWRLALHLSTGGVVAA